ncbi:sugar ABC transporter substrate-binding protein [Plantactinospora soyae]|uniref:Multiple sugar transport system substrate-binding protein n=1 Tax=Plantactinospora soyae TaxID=1544732 RepID=A0A927LXW9_9ACTN|nr:extracellular solute-binding protein [Plantactinospora soyae]MBE1484419.1 multiple sugar transport system substrate-binding protein [Plantactinospora soyae]
MRVRKIGATAASVLLLMSLAACGDDGGGGGEKTLTYWASNQGPSLDADRQVLQPELDKFTQQTGIKVELEVIGWPDLLNRILAATASGQGPDVLNIGNTWSASLQATGAFLPFESAEIDTLGGKDRFLGPSFAATGATGQPPTSMPLYGLAYGLFYHKRLFAEAGITTPPKNWTEFVAAGKRLTKGGQWGLAVEGASYTENAHHAFIFGQQHGADFFDGAGKPQFTGPHHVMAVKQYLDFMATDKIANPSNAEYSTPNQPIGDFAKGKAAMLLWQSNAISLLAAAGMKPDEYGVAPIPIADPLPPGGKRVNSHVAGINISVFKNTENRDGALELVKFLTSSGEQQILNKALGSLPVVKDAYSDPAFETPVIKVFQDVLANTAGPLPQVPEESKFETTVGSGMRDLFAKIASGQPVGEAEVAAALTKAQQEMGTGG